MSRRFFLSYVRRGAAGGSWGSIRSAGRCRDRRRSRPELMVARDGGELPLIVGPTYGSWIPATCGISRSFVTRPLSRAWFTDVPANELAYIEFSRPDLPWMFTPASATPEHRLRPWIVLVVVPLGGTIAHRTGSHPARRGVRAARLAGIECVGACAGHGGEREDIGPAVVRGGAGAVSRLVCPRRLQEGVFYHACVVPAFDAALNRVGRRRRGNPRDPDLRLVDVSRRREGGLRGAGAAPAPGRIHGLRWGRGRSARSGHGRPGRRCGHSPALPTIRRQRSSRRTARWRHPGRTSARRSTTPVRRRFVRAWRSTSISRSSIPIPRQETILAKCRRAKARAWRRRSHGGHHANVQQVNADATRWIEDLNLDPRRRAAAAMGSRYVQEHQEFLMARAWEQLRDIEKANQLRRIAQLASVTADAVHRRSVTTLRPTEVIGLAGPARTRIRRADQTLSAEVASSVLPEAVATPAFARLTRPMGPIAHRMLRDRPSTLIERGLQGEEQVLPPRMTAAAPRVSLIRLSQSATGDVTTRRTASHRRLVGGAEEATLATALSAAQQAVNDAETASAGGMPFPGGLEAARTGIDAISRRSIFSPGVWRACAPSSTIRRNCGWRRMSYVTSRLSWPGTRSRSRSTFHGPAGRWIRGGCASRWRPSCARRSTWLSGCATASTCQSPARGPAAADHGAPRVPRPAGAGARPGGAERDPAGARHVSEQSRGAARDESAVHRSVSRRRQP